jgi:Aldo/keto reductases, related to diketogulonate reductase
MLSKYSPKLVEYCKSKGIHCTAYSCLGGNTASAINAHTTLLEDPIVLKIAEGKNQTPAQILYVIFSQVTESMLTNTG